MDSTNLYALDGDFVQGQIERVVDTETDSQAPEINNPPLVAEDPATCRLLHLAERVARSNVTVMLGGKSGTGKEVFARYIHQHSSRTTGPFVAVNCAAIPDNMLEALLFGYEKGAFTGAYQSAPGKFEQAQGGTLLLDEISEMTLDLQAKLLRVIQEREVERLGGRRLIKLDVRVLATSNRVLREEVSAGRFREDLFYRLNVFPITLPLLRDRPGDILPLARHLLQRFGAGRPIQLSKSVEQSLLAYSWPGNVRELENLMQRALVLTEGDLIEEAALMFEMEEGISESVPIAKADGALNEDLRDVEAQIILKTLEENNGSRKRTAEILGISARTLRYKMARMRDAGLDVPR
jgi:two-component system response regulator FlrC